MRQPSFYLIACLCLLATIARVSRSGAEDQEEVRQAQLRRELSSSRRVGYLRRRTDIDSEQVTLVLKDAYDKTTYRIIEQQGLDLTAFVDRYVSLDGQIDDDSSDRQVRFAAEGVTALDDQEPATARATNGRPPALSSFGNALGPGAPTGPWAHPDWESPGPPGAEPVAPIEEPRAPREGPSTPREEPRTPRDEPSTPREEPRAPREEPSTPRAGEDDLSLDLNLQSGVSESRYAFTPPLIGDFFDGGSTTSIISRTVTQSFSATGTIVSGAAGSPFAQLAFDINADSIPDFISVGQGADLLAPSPDADTFQVVESVPSTAPIVCPPGATFRESNAINSTGTFVNGDIWRLDYVCSQDFTLVLPNPAGSVVGRQKIAENGSPIPRNRVFVNYSLFDNVPLRAGGVTVNRFTPGFEAASPGEDASVEARFPFAATLDPNILADGPSDAGNLQFGNIFLTFKKILEQADDWLVSGGLSVTIPTARGIEVSLTDGNQLVQVDNRAVHVMPFIGGLAELTDRTYAQGFLQLDFDTSGNPVLVNSTGSGLRPAGTIQDTSLMYLDLSLGHWLRRPGERPDALLYGIVPTIELHINRSLKPTDVVTSGSFRIGERRENLQILNLVLGSTFQFSEKSAVTVGYATPIGNGLDQMFDGELRTFWNRYF